MWHSQELFNVGGRNPSTRTDGDWLERKAGRTLYIGKAKHGKGLRIYEKGKQLGDLESQWVRFEVQFGNRDRIIPFDVLTDPTRFFVGTYPACEQIIHAAAERIQTVSQTAIITLESLLTSIKRTYGKWLNIFAENIDSAELIQAISITQIPKRIQVGAVSTGMLPDMIKTGFTNWRETWQLSA